MLGKTCKDAIIMTIISRAIIGASLLISTFFGLLGVVVANSQKETYQDDVQAIMVSNCTQNTHPYNNPSVHVKIEVARSAAFWANISDSDKENSTKKNIAHAILKTATGNSNNTSYDWKYINSSGNGEVYAEEISPNASKIFPVRIPKRNILKKEKRSKLTITLSENDLATSGLSHRGSGPFCTILCTRGASNTKPLNCRIAQHNDGNSNQYQCDIAQNFRKIEVSNVKLYGAKNRIKNKLKKEQDYIIPTTLILVYKPIDNVYPSAPAFDKGTHPPSYSSSTGSDLYTLKGGYHPPKILNLPK